MIIDRYTLTAAQFDGLAAGYGDPGALAVLRAGQLAKRKLLLAGLLDTVSGPLRAALDPALDLLVDVERTHPEVVDDILSLPHVDAWATLCLSRPADAGHLARVAALATAAAVRAGVDFDLEVPTFGGDLCLPGVGLAIGAGSGPVRVTSSGLGVFGWVALRTVELEPGYAVILEDQDPYRHCYQWRPAPPLDRAAADRFAARLVDAWRLIVTYHPAHAEAMRIGLRSVVPLADPGPDGNVSAASRQASGSVALALPSTAEELALLLIHEFQHAKLGALLDLVDLHHAEPKGRYHAPWRLDPRPVGQLLQGVYAHAGVTDYWRVRRDRFGSGDRLATVEYAYWREQNRIAAGTLADCGELTPEGERFVAGLRATLDSWQADPVPPDVDRGVAAMVLAQEVRWRLRNWQPGDDEAARFAAAVRDGRPVADVGPRGILRPPDDEATPAGLPGLVGMIRASLVDGGVPDGGSPAGADPADRALLAGDHVVAVAGYLDRLGRDPADWDAWVGLAVAAEPAGNLIGGPASLPVWILHMRPELVRYALTRSSGRVVDLAAVEYIVDSHHRSP
jgi:HEXXH motif-containing protein